MSMTMFQEEVLTGLMIGDGHLSIGKKAKNPRLRISRAIIDLEYAKWIAMVFEKYCTQKSLKESSPLDRRNGKRYGRTFFCTRRHPDFLSAYQRWYGTGKKWLPEHVSLTPVVAAVWFADDGGLYQKHRNGSTAGIELSIATCSFGRDGSEKLKDLLCKKLGPGFNVYGGYRSAASKHFKIIASTRPARRFLRYIDAVFPPMSRKSDFWRNGDFSLDGPPLCPICKEDAVFHNGFYCGRGTIRLAQRMKCRKCGHRWKEEIN